MSISSPHTASERAVSLMRQLGVPPLPRHYTIFFACASGVPAGLVAEVEKLIAEKHEFSSEVLERLHDTYIANEQHAVQETTASAKKILAEMVASLATFTGTTKDVSEKMAAEIEEIGDGDLNEDTLKRLAKTVIDSAKTIKGSSDAVAVKLATAQQEVVALRENLTKATEESEKDFLTGCHNRKSFDRHLLEAIFDANANDSELALLMLDIDHFKSFNDNFGHQIGDEVLKIVARAMTDSVKGMDTVARFGGEEFAVILPRTPVGGGMIVAEGIRKMIAGKELKRRSTGENYGTITVSVGVAALRRKADTAESLLRRADEALYRSKKSGRNKTTQEDLSSAR